MNLYLSAVVASGYHVSIADAAITATLGYVVVFIGLILLQIVVMIMSKIVTSTAAQKEISAPPSLVSTADSVSPGVIDAPAAVVAPGSAGQVKLYDTPPREAAMVMAIVANKTGKPLNALRFISIKEVK